MQHLIHLDDDAYPITPLFKEKKRGDYATCSPTVLYQEGVIKSTLWIPILLNERNVAITFRVTRGFPMI